MKRSVLVCLCTIFLFPNGLSISAFAQGNQPPTLQDPDDRSTTAGDEVLIQSTGSDPNSDPLTYSATGSVPPAMDKRNFAFIERLIP